MADIFREVEEDLQHERLMRLWHSYRDWLIGAVILILVATGAWKYYQHRQQLAAAALSDAYEQARELIKDGADGAVTSAAHEQAYRAFSDIAGRSSGGYAFLAKLQAAGHAAHFDRAMSVNLYDALAKDASYGALFQDLARLRAGLLRLEDGSLEEVKQRFEILTQPARPFRHSAREALAFFLLHHQKLTEAAGWFDEISRDSEASEPMRQRADSMLEFIRSLQ